MTKRLLRHPGARQLLAGLAGLAMGLAGPPQVGQVARHVVAGFSQLLALLGVPIVFLALLTTLLASESQVGLRWLGRQVATYTLGTTFLAASIALLIYRWVDPIAAAGGASAPASSAPPATMLLHVAPTAPDAAGLGELLAVLSAWMPRHVLAPFVDGNVAGAVALAVVLGLALWSAPVAQRQAVLLPAQALLAAGMRVMRAVMAAMPLLLWAAMVVFCQALGHSVEAAALGRYLGCVVGANLCQAILVLPLLLRLHGLSPWRVFRGMGPALATAFFSKSSVATLPQAIACAEEGCGVRPEVARFVFPLCTSINMNACAAFILTTVLFVCETQGHVFGPAVQLGWVALATLAAVGNAGVPMGCFTLASVILSALGVEATTMAIILPFYGLLDMLETAVNVWSDGSIAAMVETRFRRRRPAPLTTPPGGLPAA